MTLKRDKRQMPNALRLTDPTVIIAGIKQFGLAPDGSDLRDLFATFERKDAALRKVILWLERLAERSEREAKDRRFVSLANAHAADAKNYRATAADLRRALADENTERS